MGKRFDDVVEEDRGVLVTLHPVRHLPLDEATLGDLGADPRLDRVAHAPVELDRLALEGDQLVRDVADRIAERRAVRNEREQRDQPRYPRYPR